MSHKFKELSLDNLFSYTLKYKYIETLRIAVFQTFGQAINSIIADLY